MSFPQLDSLTGDGLFSCYNDASLNGSGQLKKKKIPKKQVVPVTPTYQFDWLIQIIMLTTAGLSTSDIM